MSIPAIAMAIPALTKAGTSLYNYYNNKSALKEASQKTDQEKEYLERLNKRRTKGALDVPKLTNQVANQAYQAGEIAKQNVQGNIVKSGLDNSIVAQELRRKTDVDTMKSIAESSREIAMRNEATKKSAESEYDKYLLTESDRLRSIAMRKAENEGQLASGLIGAVGSGASAYFDNQENIQKKEFSQNIIKEIQDAGGISTLSDDQLQMYILRLTGGF